MIAIGTPTAVTVGDDYTDAATILDAAIDTVYFSVVTHDAVVQLAKGTHGQLYWSPEFSVQAGQGGSFSACSGIRFRNAVAGSAAAVAAVGFTPADPQAGALALAAAVTVTSSFVNQDHNGALIATEPGINFADGADVTWTAVDTAGSFVTFTPVVGVTVPRLLASSLLAAPAATVNFAGLAGTFQTLLLAWVARSDNATAAVPLRVQFNGDAGANYDDETLHWNAAAATLDSNAVAAGSIYLANIAGASATAGLAGVGDARIPGYAGTTFQKAIRASFEYATSNLAAGQFAGIGSGKWRNTGAINRVTFVSGAGNFIAGSQFAIWGM